MCFLGLVAGLVWSVLGLLAPSTGMPYPVGDGCVAAHGGSCSYRAQQVGSIEGVGTVWRVDIVRGKRTLHCGPKDWSDADGGVVVARDVIRPGDRVRAISGAFSPPFFGFVSVGANDRVGMEPRP